MKLKLTESQIRKVIKITINEEYNTIYDWDEFMISNLTDIFLDIKNGEKVTFSGKINPNQYKAALNEFIKYGEFFRFPVKYIYRWKDIVLENIATLYNLTCIHGHSSYFPYDEFYDLFEIPEDEQDNDFDKVYDILYNKYDIDSHVPFYSNGQPVLSDYGMQPLLDLGSELLEKNTPEEIIVVINKILDITHPRSDLAELFIDGGAKSLNDISGFEKLAEKEAN